MDERLLGEEALTWSFANLGYDTQRNLWFLECFDSHGQPADFHTAKELVVVNGWGSQFQFRDERPEADLWHVRERIFAKDVATVVAEDDKLIITFADPQPYARDVPEGWDHLQYAYLIRGPIPWGFVEFFDKEGRPLGKLLGLFVHVERLTHFTVGSYPAIRFRANREDVEDLVVTDCNVVIVGKRKGSGG